MHRTWNMNAYSSSSVIIFIIPTLFLNIPCPYPPRTLTPVVDLLFHSRRLSNLFSETLLFFYLFFVDPWLTEVRIFHPNLRPIFRPPQKNCPKIRPIFRPNLDFWCLESEVKRLSRNWVCRQRLELVPREVSFRGSVFRMYVFVRLLGIGEVQRMTVGGVQGHRWAPHSAGTVWGCKDHGCVVYVTAADTYVDRRRCTAKVTKFIKKTSLLPISVSAPCANVTINMKLTTNVALFVSSSCSAVYVSISGLTGSCTDLQDYTQ